MQYLDLNNDLAEEDTFGVGKHGFTEGDLGNTPRSLIRPAGFLNPVLRELLAAIEGGGLTPSGGDLTQLAQVLAALRTNIANGRTEHENVITAAGLTVDDNDLTQLLTAIQTLITDVTTEQHPIMRVTASGSNVSEGSNLTLTAAFSAPTVHGYSIASDELSVGATGIYVVSLSGTITSESTTNPALVTLRVGDDANVNTRFDVVAARYNTNAAQAIPIAGSALLRITDTSAQKISVNHLSSTDAAQMAAGTGLALSVTYLRGL